MPRDDSAQGGTPPPADDAQFRQALDTLLEGFQIIAPDWTYVYVNAAAARHGRRSSEELIGLRMHEAYPGIEATPLFSILRRAMTERTSHTFENLFTYPDGTSRWFELRIEPVREGICVLSIDITDRKEADAQRLRVFKATMTTVHEIVNNALTNLQYVRVRAEDRLDGELLQLFDRVIDETSSKLRGLGTLQEVNERALAVGPGIDWPGA